MEGIITEWDDERGFGFLETTEVKDRIFVHISAFESSLNRPQVGDEISFVMGRDEQGRERAIHAAFLFPPAENQRKSSTRQGLNALFMLFMVAFSSLLLMAITPPMTWPVLAAILILSPVTFVIYGRDKIAAINHRWRTPEATLQLLALCGGWPGALIAQRHYRHKTSKLSFQVMFYLMITINCLIRTQTLAKLQKPTLSLNRKKARSLKRTIL